MLASLESIFQPLLIQRGKRIESGSAQLSNFYTKRMKIFRNVLIKNMLVEDNILIKTTHFSKKIIYSCNFDTVSIFSFQFQQFANISCQNTNFFFLSFLGRTEQTDHWVNPWVHTTVWLSELGHKSKKKKTDVPLQPFLHFSKKVKLKTLNYEPTPNSFSWICMSHFYNSIFYSFDLIVCLVTFDLFSNNCL